MEKKKTMDYPKGYTKQIVVFLDVLGFSDAIKRSAKDTSIYLKINLLLKQFQEIIAMRKNFHVKIHSFSDNIFLSCPTVSMDSFNEVCWIVSEFCVKTIFSGFFLRGALTIGLCQEEAGTLFGPACVRAYELEKSLALWPRIIIDPYASKNSDISPGNFWKKHNYLITGDDRLPYLDYLGFTLASYKLRSALQKNTKKAFEDLEFTPKLALTLLKKQKDNISSAIREAKTTSDEDTLMLSKYYPLVTYHNLIIGRTWTDVNNPNPDYAKTFIELYKTNIGHELTEEDKKIIDEHLPSVIESFTNYRAQFREQLLNIDTLFE